jgi:hypothetical protein
MMCDPRTKGPLLEAFVCAGSIGRLVLVVKDIASAVSLWANVCHGRQCADRICNFNTGHNEQTSADAFLVYDLIEHC